MSAPFFSIIVATHVRPDLLERALRSVTNQQFRDYEIVLVADEASAATYNVACQNLRSQDTFIKRSGPPGPARSRNIGLDVAQGQFILFLDDDDSHRQNCLSELHRNIDLSKGSLVYFDYEVVTELRSEGPPDIKDRKAVHLNAERVQDLLIYNFIPNNAFSISSAIARKFRFDESLRSHEDWEFLIAIACEGYQFVHVPILGVAVHQDYSSNQRNSSAKKSADWPLDLLYIYRKWPASDLGQKQRRHNALQALGHNVSLSGL